MDDEFPVTLAWHELAIAAQVGVRRHIEALKGGRRDSNGFRDEEGEGWHIHIEGAAGEMSLAKFRGVYWNGSVNTFRSGGDVGELQVKTRSRHDYDLLVHHYDRDEDIYWLVTGKAPRFVIRGWMPAWEAKDDRYLQGHGGRDPAYFVPQTDLYHPLEYDRCFPGRGVPV